MTNIAFPPPRVLFPQPTHGTSDCSNDCDCACALDTISPSPQLNTRWKQNPHLKPLTLPNATGWRSFYNPNGPSALVILNDSAVQLLTGCQTPGPLRANNPQEQIALQQMAQTGLLIPADKPAFTPPLSALTAWLHITDSCNLRCDYCYLPHNPITIREPILSQSIQMLFKTAQKHHYPRVKLKYAGGEPLLQFNLVQRAHSLAFEQSRQNDIPLDEVLLTNGTRLSQEKIAYLQRNQIRVMISLDGIGQWHDQQRHFAKGKPSFELVRRGIELCQKMGLTPLISLTLSSRNLPGLPQAISWLLEHKLPFTFNFYRENDYARGVPPLDINHPQTRQLFEEAFALLEADPPDHSLLGMLADRASFGFAHLYPCGVGRDYLVIRSDGQIAKCQMAMDAPVTSIFALDPLTEVRQDKTGIQNPPVFQKPDCAACDWRAYCAGGCPLLTQRVTGSYEARSPYCELYQFLFPRLLHLEASRLIKTASGRLSR